MRSDRRKKERIARTLAWRGTRTELLAKKVAEAVEGALRLTRLALMELGAEARWAKDEDERQVEDVMERLEEGLEGDDGEGRGVRDCPCAIFTFSPVHYVTT